MTLANRMKAQLGRACGHHGGPWFAAARVGRALASALIVLGFASGVGACSQVLGQEPSAGTPQPSAGTPQPSAGTPQRAALESQQEQLAERYRKIEELLLKLADVEAAENPERAALLRRAARQSREKFILDRLETAANSLSSKQYQQALDNQNAAREELATLLKLLTSEDRPQRIREERERIGNYIKELKRIERTERATRARTENGADLDEVEGEQREITARAKEMEAQLAEENGSQSGEQGSEDSGAESGKSETERSESGEESSGESGEREDSSERDASDAGDEEKQSGEETERSEGEQGKESEGSEGDSTEQEGESREQEGERSGEEGKQSEGKQSEGKQSEGQQSEGQQSEGQQSEGQQSEGQQSEGQQSEGQQSEGQQSEGQQAGETPPRTPEEAAERALRQARERMEEAQRQLEKANREQAVEAQRAAEEELRAAIDQLEKILRQLREEEMLRELARLEARLRQMAQMQGTVLDKTRQLAETPLDQRDRQIDIRAGNLAFDERKIVLEADRAILLLREEGSSVAFPEVVGQMRSDMVRVAERLTETKIDGITQGIQEDILAALEEMIGALQKAQRDLEEQQRQQQQQQGQPGGQPGEQPLVQPLAELKLLRTMQTRIKSRTENYAELIPEAGSEGALTEGQALDGDLLGLLQNLSDRQRKLYRITRDLLLRRNQ